jgi:hypothetical protein
MCRGQSHTGIGNGAVASVTHGSSAYFSMVLQGGIEPPTSSLPMKCSTTELLQLVGTAPATRGGAPQANCYQQPGGANFKNAATKHESPIGTMTEAEAKLKRQQARELRLAEELRINLVKRKALKREKAVGVAPSDEKPPH